MAEPTPALMPPDPRPKPVTDNRSGVLWMVAAVALFTVMGVLIKYLAPDLHAHQITFFRCALGLLTLAPLLWMRGFKVMRTTRPWLHLLRAIAGTLSMMGMFYAVAYMDYASATAISYARPLFLIPIAILVLGEVVRWRRGVATLVGFLGVIMVIQPDARLFGEGVDPWPPLAALSSAATLAIVIASIRALAQTEEAVTILVWFAMVSAVLTAIPAWIVWKDPDWIQLLMLLAIGVCGTIGQYMTIRSYRVAETTVVAPAEYVQILMSAGAGFLLFNEIPSVWTALGAVVIVGSTLYILQREAKLAKAPPPTTTTE